MPPVAPFLQDYLNLEVINFFLRTCESSDEAKLKLERIGRRAGRKLTEMFPLLFHIVNSQSLFFSI